MALEPSSPKQITILNLLTPVVGALLMTGLYLWYVKGGENPPIPAELKAADKALSAGKVDQARGQFEKLLFQAPESPEIYKVIMADCGAHNRWDLAWEYGERSLDACKYASNPARADLYLTLANFYEQGGEKPPQPTAQQHARRALELDPDNPSLLNGLGYILADNARTEQETTTALGYINRALKLERDTGVLPPGLLAVTEDSYGWALYKRGAFDLKSYTAAADALSQAIDDLPLGASATAQKTLYYHLGAACRAAGRNEDARHALEIALHYDPNDATTLKELQAMSSVSSTPPAPPPPTTTPDGKPIFKPLLDHKPMK